MQTQATTASDPSQRIKCQPQDEDGGFDRLLTHVRAWWSAITSDNRPIFVVEPASADPLHDVWLGAIPVRYRQHYTCNCCRHFFERFGALAVVSEDGSLQSALWSEPSEVPVAFRDAVEALRRAVTRGAVSGVFLTGDAVLGTPQTGPWTHLSLQVPAHRVHRDPLKSASQAAAAVREDRGALLRGMAEFPRPVVEQALALLRSGTFYRSEKCEAAAKWLLALHDGAWANKDARRKDRLLWVAAATAPAGFCHVKSGVLGSLLEDLQAGLPTEVVRARFAEKMDPLQYQRPQAPPSAGNLAQAEAVVAKLATAGALARRFATLPDVVRSWEPAPPKAPTAPTGGVFSHLRPQEKTQRTTDIGHATQTWVKFRAEVLPEAAKVEFLVPPHLMSYMALVTAQDPAAPPIVQWDSLERRNPVTWYVYSGGSPPQRWNLSPSQAVEVTAVCGLPHTWHGGNFSHHGDGALLVLRGCRDTGYQAGAGFFPEHLRSEYHSVRSSMEAYARNAAVAGIDQPDLASGLDLRKGNAYQGVRLRVTSRQGTVCTYTIDRWD